MKRKRKKKQKKKRSLKDVDLPTGRASSLIQGQTINESCEEYGGVCFFRVNMEIGMW
jgi:hypothetical protein